MVGSAVSPGRWFPFLSGAGPSPLYHGGEPARVLDVHHHLYYFRQFQDLAYASRMLRTLKRGMENLNLKVGYEDPIW